MKTTKIFIVIVLAITVVLGINVATGNFSLKPENVVETNDFYSKPEDVAENFLTAYFESDGFEALNYMSDIAFSLQANGDKAETERAKYEFAYDLNNDDVSRFTIQKIECIELNGFERDEYVYNFLNNYFYDDSKEFYYDIYSDCVGKVVYCTVDVEFEYADGYEEEDILNIYLWKEYGEWVVCELD